MNDLKSVIVKRYGTQYAFSKALGIREEVVCRVVTGRRRLSPEQAAAWSAALGCDVLALIEG